MLIGRIGSVSDKSWTPQGNAKARTLCEPSLRSREGSMGNESGSESTPASEGLKSPSTRVPTSCTKAFDSLYYCYSPFYQGKVYYQTGELDDCRGRLRRFRMCVMSRFRSEDDSKKLYEEVADEEAKQAAPPVWQLRKEYVDRIRSVEEAERKALQESGTDGDDGTAWWL